MTGVESLLVLVAGLAAGILSSTVGVASLVSFPALVAVGLPPVVANVSNTIGMTPAGLSGSFGYRRELRVHPGVTVAMLTTCAIGGVLGAALLLSLPSAVFEFVIPWLILFTCLLVGIQPFVKRWVRQRRGDDEQAGPRTRLGPVTAGFATLTGVYGGYFGAGAGVMMMAVLGFGTDLEFRIVNALKTLALLSSNLVATVIFLVVAEVDWPSVLTLAAGSVVGGFVGAKIGNRLPEPALRGAVVLAGIVAAWRLWS